MMELPLKTRSKIRDTTMALWLSVHAEILSTLPLFAIKLDESHDHRPNFFFALRPERSDDDEEWKPQMNES